MNISISIKLKCWAFVISLGPFLVTHSSCFSQTLNVKNGLFNISSDELNSIVPLRGTWAFYNGELLAPSQLRSSTSDYKEFPMVWNDLRKDGNGSGFATYALTIIVPENQKRFGLKLPQIYSSYSLWVNSILIAKNGQVGKTKNETTAQWMPQSVYFEKVSDTISLVLQVANFHHFKGGIKDDIFIGTDQQIKKLATSELIGNLIEFGVLALLSIAFFCLYLLHKKKLVILYFSLLCVTWAIRSIFSGNYLFISFFPNFNWQVMVRIEYLSLFLTMIWAILFISKLFKEESNTAFKYLMVLLNVSCGIFALLASPVGFTQFITFYIVSCCSVLIYCVIVAVRAWSRQRLGGHFLLGAILLGVVVFTCDIIVYEGFFSFQSVLFSMGYLAAFSLMAPALLQHLKIIKSNNASTDILTYQDLYK